MPDDESEAGGAAPGPGAAQVAEAPAPAWNDERVIGCQFSFRCSQRWEALRRTVKDDVRRCDACDKDVYFVHSEEVLRIRWRSGHCVAVPTRVVDGPVPSRGDVLVGTIPCPPPAPRVPVLGPARLVFRTPVETTPIDDKVLLLQPDRPVRIGTAPDNEVVLNDSSRNSAVAARIVHEDGEFIMEAGKEEVLEMQGRLLRRRRLRHNDAVSLGYLEVLFRADPRMVTRLRRRALLLTAAVLGGLGVVLHLLRAR